MTLKEYLENYDKELDENLAADYEDYEYNDFEKRKKPVRNFDEVEIPQMEKAKRAFKDINVIKEKIKSLKTKLRSGSLSKEEEKNLIKTIDFLEFKLFKMSKQYGRH